MGLIKSIKARISSALGPRLSSLIFRTGFIEVFTEMNVQRAIDRGFNQNIAVYSIVMTDAEKFAYIPRYVYDASSVEEKSIMFNVGTRICNVEFKAGAQIIDNTALTDLLNRPNEYESQDAFFTRLRAYYKVCGEAFVWLNRGDTMVVDATGQLQEQDDEVVSMMPVLEMYALPSNYMSIVPDPENIWGIDHFILNVGGRRIPLRKVDVIHWKSVNLKFNADTRTHLRGMAPLEPGYKTLQQNEDATNASVRMYQNDGAKGVLTNKTFDKASPEQQTQIKNIIDSKINNNDVKGAVAALQGEWDYKSLGNTSVDLQLLEGKELSWKELCFLFGVPFEFFDSKTTFANKEQAQNGWVMNKIIPACKQFDGELNRVLLKSFGLVGKAFIASDFTDLLMAQRDMALLITSLAAAWWITPNEKREQMNEDLYNDPQFDEPWVPAGFTPLSQMNDQAQMDQITQELANRGLAGSMNGNGKQ